jgi:hypothetical protein
MYTTEHLCWFVMCPFFKYCNFSISYIKSTCVASPITSTYFSGWNEPVTWLYMHHNIFHMFIYKGCFIASSTSWPERPARKASFTVTRVPAKWWSPEYRINTSQLFELQDNDKKRCTLIENGSVDWCPAHLYRNHNKKGEPQKRKQCINFRMTILKRKM